MINSKRKYRAWGNYLKKQREAKFRSARDFCSKVELGISYPQYSRYEAGEQLPNLEQALALGRILEMPTLEMILEWSRAQISDSETVQELEALLTKARDSQSLPKSSPTGKQSSGLGIFSQATVPLDDVIVFNRSHLKLFLSDPAYRDIFTYINSFAPEWITAEELTLALGIALPKLQKMLDRLDELGVIKVSANKCRVTKSNFYFPDDEEFFSLRNLNLTHNATQIMRRLSYADLQERRAYRSLVTRELTERQLDQVLGQLDGLMSQIVRLPESDQPQKIYSVCVLAGERFTRAFLK